MSYFSKLFLVDESQNGELIQGSKNGELLVQTFLCGREYELLALCPNCSLWVRANMVSYLSKLSVPEESTNGKLIQGVKIDKYLSKLFFVGENKNGA